ncbi:thiamine phosphate synthase, partial [Gemmatimonas sp.]
MGVITPQLRLYLVTDPVLCAARGVVDTVRDAVRGGVTMVQLRDKDATTAERVALGRALMEVLAGTN